MPRQYEKGNTLTFRDANDGVPLEEQAVLTGTVHVTIRTRGGKSIYWVSVSGVKGDYTVFEHEIVEEPPRFRVTYFDRIQYTHELVLPVEAHVADMQQAIEEDWSSISSNEYEVTHHEEEWTPLNEAARVLMVQEQEGKERKSNDI